MAHPYDFTARYLTVFVLLVFDLLHSTNGPLLQSIAAFQTQPICKNGMGSLEETYRALAARRVRHIARLHDYAAAGKYPLNTDFPGRLVPYFVDKAGTACAVGHLMRLDGQQQLVNSIASSTNHVRIENVHEGPLLEWIHDSGLTQDECALIQPSYACIEDYRRGRPWQDEIARLKKHFAEAQISSVECG